MNNLMRRVAAPLVLGAAVAGGVMGCNNHPAQHVTPAQSAMAKADARSLTAKCIPAGAAAQLKLAASLKTVSGRQSFEMTCGIPPAHKQAFETQVLNAAEAGHLTTHAGRTTFFSVTLPKIIEENQG